MPPLDFLVVYAPHLGYPEAVHTAWWQSIRVVIRKCRRAAAYLTVMGDINGTLGEVQSGAVGDVAPVAQCGNGEEFHQGLLESDLWLPATCQPFAGGGLDVQHTFEATAGAPHADRLHRGGPPPSVHIVHSKGRFFVRPRCLQGGPLAGAG